MHGNVAVITLDNPPVNGLGHALRSKIAGGVTAAQDDTRVQAIVLIGAGRAFSGGADIREFNTPKMLAKPSLFGVLKTLDESAKPVVAAMHGVAMGGGLELALTCHFRVASPGAQVALPEVKIGLVPGAGGTQRLPRVVGQETALNMIVSGNLVPAEKLADTKLFDGMIDGDLLEGALAFANKVVAERRPLRRVRDLKIDHPNPEGFLKFAANTVAAVAKGYPAPLACVECLVAATTLPFDEGLKRERELFMKLMQSRESRALRHAFLAERAASKIPDVPDDTPLRPIRSAAVVGAGTMGGGIAMNFANAGIPVTILEMKQEALDKGLGTIRKNYESTAKKGRLTPDKMQQRLDLIKGTLDYRDIANADIVIEAVFEDMGVKEQVFGKLDEVMKPGAILASNTSTLDVDRIASFTKRPQDVIGTHFFSPANVMKLLEVIRGKATAKDVLATTMKLSKTIKKTGVVSGVCDGFIGNRMLEQYLRQAMFLVEEGALPWDVDRAMEKFGMAMGPFRMSDMAGLDVGWYIRKRRYVEKPHMKYSRWVDRICEMGRFGQKTGAGIYKYEAGRRDAIPDPAIAELVTSYSKEIGVARRKISEDEIVERCVYALVNEGAKILDEGIAQRASDIDMVYLTGYGFPLYRGGPMLYADMEGLPDVVASMREFAQNPHGDPGFWEPAPLLAKLAAEGKTFNG
jgi:3-hydroxyacyl-CoA dehydrogenase